MYRIRQKEKWWNKHQRLYLFWNYDYDKKDYYVGPLEVAQLHKFNFKDNEIGELRNQHPDFDNEFVLEESHVGL